MTFRTGDGHEVNNILVIDSGGNIQSVPSVAINQAKSAMDATNLKLEVNGDMSVRAGGYLYQGITSNSINSWKTRIGNGNSSLLYINSQGLQVDNTGYANPAVIFLKANASGVDGTTFRDLDNTAYYTNPASNSVLNTADIQRLDVNNTGFISFYGNGSEDHSIGSYLDDDIRINSYGAMYISLDSNGNNDSNADFLIVKHAGGSSSWAATQELFKVDGETNAVTIGNTQVDATINALASMVLNIDSDNNSSGESFFVKHNANTSGGGSTLFSVSAAGNAEATTSSRAPIFYDSDNTAYYVNPAGITSNAGSISGKFAQTVIIGDGSQLNSNDGSWGARLNLTDSVHSKIEIGQDTNSMRSHWYAHSGQDSIKFGTYTNHDVEFQRNNTTVLELMANDRVGINIGSHDYTGHSNVDQYILTLNTDYTAEGQNFHFVNHNGNWVDGTSGGDTAYGLMWGYQNLIRAGIHYDHRGQEKFDFYSSYGEIRFRTPASVNGNISPIGSESTMPSRLTIGVGGSVTSHVDLRTPILYDTGNTGFFVNPAGSTKLEELNLHGGTNQATDDATLYVNKTNNNDWLIKAEGTSSATEYGITVRMPGTHTQAYHATNAGNEYYRVGTDMVLHNASIRSPIFYDSNNTTYYLDASSTGTSLNIAGNAIIPGYASIAGVELSSGVTRTLTGIGDNNWVTIANFNGGRKQDIIEIHDDESSRHNILKMQVAWSFGQGSIQIINAGRHGSRTINQVRLLYNTADRTYATGKLQVYLTSWGTSRSLKIKQQAWSSGNWGKSSIPSTAETGLPSGYTVHEGTTLEVNEDPNGTFGTTGRAVVGMGIDMFHGSPIKFHTTAGDGISTERGFIDAQEGGHLRIATSGGENIVFQDGGVGGTTNLTILGSGEMVKEATERFTIKSHTNSWDGGLRFYASDNSTIFQMHPDTNGQMYVDREWRFQNSQINYGPIRRGSHHSGFLEGSYNNIGGNGSKSNPIYTIGSSYNPSDAALGNMYGIGYTNVAASFISGSLAHGDWGMYVAADGDARIFLDGTNGHGAFLGSIRASSFYDIDNTSYYLDPGNGTTALYTNGAWRQTSTNWTGEVPGKMQYHANHWYIQAQGYVHFRNASGNNTFYVDTAAGNGYISNQLAAGGDLRAPIFYDSADTSYYYDGNNATCSLKTRGSIRIGYGGHLGLGAIGIPKLAIPGDTAAWSGSGTTTGQVVIDLPGTLANYDMMYFEVDVYEYSARNATKIIVGGHNWNSGGNGNTSSTMWHNVGVKIIGDMDKSVFFGWRNDGTNNRRVMVIGSPTSSWSYGTVRVSSVSGATDFYSGSIDYTADWNVTQSTSSSYYTKNPTTDFNSTGEKTLKTHGRMAAYGYQGNGNVGGTGEASWHPSGIYSNSTNWLYGQIVMNNNLISGCRSIAVGADNAESHILRRNNASNTEIRTHATGATSGLLVRNGSDQFRFQLYGDGTNYGFLDGVWASWDLRKTTNGALYLNGNTSYYLQPESTSNMNAAGFAGDVTIGGDVAINNGSPELYFGTVGNHYNWRLAAQENVNAAFEISVGSQDTNYANDTYTTKFHINNVGDGTFAGNVTAYSDERLKENIETLDGSKVYEMRGVSFEKEGIQGSGVIAQELEKIAPELVQTTEDEIGTKSVAYGNLVGYLIEAVKELKSEVDDLKEQLKNK